MNYTGLTCKILGNEVKYIDIYYFHTVVVISSGTDKESHLEFYLSKKYNRVIHLI